MHLRRPRRSRRARSHVSSQSGSLSRSSRWCASAGASGAWRRPHERRLAAAGRGGCGTRSPAATLRSLRDCASRDMSGCWTIGLLSPDIVLGWAPDGQFPKRRFIGPERIRSTPTAPSVNPWRRGKSYYPERLSSPPRPIAGWKGCSRQLSVDYSRLDVGSWESNPRRTRQQRLLARHKRRYSGPPRVTPGRPAQGKRSWSSAPSVRPRSTWAAALMQVPAPGQRYARHQVARQQ